MNFETWWKDYDNVQCDKDACEDAFYFKEISNPQLKSLHILNRMDKDFPYLICLDTLFFGG